MKNIITVFNEIIGYYGKRVAVIYEEKEYTYDNLMIILIIWLKKSEKLLIKET